MKELEGLAWSDVMVTMGGVRVNCTPALYTRHVEYDRKSLAAYARNWGVFDQYNKNIGTLKRLRSRAKPSSTPCP